MKQGKGYRILPRECTGHNKHSLPTTQKKTLHMDITRWSTSKSDWLYSSEPKMEKLYIVSKNKTRSWLWLRWESVCLQYGRPWFNPWVGKISCRRKWQSTPVFLLGKSYGWRSLVGYSPWGRKKSDRTEWPHSLTHEYLQDLLELTPKKDVLFIIGDWNAKARSPETPGITGKFGLGMQNEAGQRLIEFSQENALVIANTLFQQHKQRLYTWASPDGQHRNQTDYILCSQRWRSSIQSTKTRPGADCGSDHELLIVKFRLKLKK